MSLRALARRPTQEYLRRSVIVSHSDVIVRHSGVIVRHGGFASSSQPHPIHTLRYIKKIIDLTPELTLDPLLLGLPPLLLLAIVVGEGWNQRRNQYFRIPVLKQAVGAFIRRVLFVTLQSRWLVNAGTSG